MEHNKLRITGHSPGRRVRRGALVLTVCAGLALGVGTPALAGTSSTGASGAAQVATPLAAPSGHTVTLPTGDRVTITTIGGQTSYSVVGPEGAATDYTSYNAFGDHFIVPDEARPYLGKQLDSSLFDVSALLRAGATTGSHIPVDLSFPSGGAPSAPPGVTLTSGSTGYLTATSGAAFAAGLRAAIGADVTAGRHPGTGALFGGLVSISLAVPGVGAAAHGSASPRFPLHILQINATDITGAPADALVFLLNVDSATRENGFAPIGGGIERVAVPAGNYSAEVLFDDFDSAGNLTALRTVFVNDFAVSATDPVTTIGVDERTATVPFTVTTPRPATSDGMQITYARQDATGATFSFGNVIFGGGVTLYSNSQPAPTVGKLHYVVQWDAAGPATGEQYRYDLAYGSSDIPANQSYTVDSGNVATVHHTFFTDPASPAGGSFLNGTYDGPNVGIGQLSGGESYAGPLTQYLGTGDGGQWVQTYFAPPSGAQYQSDVHTFQGGSDYEVEWAHGPLAPDFGKHTGPQLFLPCLACASGDVLVAAVNIDGDSEPDHVGFPLFGETTHYALYQNGVQVEDLGSGYLGAELTGVPVAPTTYRLVYDTDNTGIQGLTQSLTTHTDVTFHYVPGTDPRSTLPSTDPCDFTGAMATPCQVLPMLNLNYHLFTNSANTGETESQGLELNIGHVTYDGFGSHAPITSASVSVSFDGGTTWQQARVVKIGDFGSYDAFWRNPLSAAGTSPELRVSATDALGGSITQTVTAAYTIAASVH
jgi:hypothetical protein